MTEQKDKKSSMKTVIPYAVYGIGVSAALFALAFSRNTIEIVVSAVVAVFFAVRLYQSK
jgi:hypothetical protein